MAFSEDFDAFLDTDQGFATEVKVDGVFVNAIFERSWQELTLGNAPYSGELPTLHGKTSDFDGKFGKTVTIGSDSYKIYDIRPDGTGMSEIIMMEQ